MASVALALLVAQTVSALLLFRAAEDRREEAMLNNAAFQLVAAPPPGASDAREDRRAERRGARRQAERRVGRAASETPMRRLPRRLRLSESDAPPTQVGEQRQTEQEEILSEILTRQGISPVDLQIVSRRAGDDPVVVQFAERAPRFRVSPEWANRTMLVAGLKREGSDQWQIVRVLEPVRARGGGWTLIAQTLILFAFLLLMLTLILRRITRPLAALTKRVGQFGETQNSADPIEPTGPDDVRNLISAQNAMETRITALLDEKDVMLGAIGHDLKTPLAALRVRIESVEDDAERAKMAASIEDITATLDDILSLARIGRAGGAPEPVELASLVTSVVEEFEDMGNPVTLGDTPRTTLPVHVTWIRRALRNLIGNALRYGGSAHVEMLREGGSIILQVSDVGPGIPEDRIAEMMEPFIRGEASRNRATGGAGLGLTLARAIAEQHGGSLKLTNRSEGGLLAQITLPT